MNNSFLRNNVSVKILKEGGWILFGQILTVLGSLVLIRVLTEYLPPIIYGQLSLGLTISILINQTIMAGIIPGIARFYTIAVDKDEVPSYIRASKKIIAYATVSVFILAFFLILILYLLGYSQWLALTTVTLIFSILVGYNSIISQVQNAARQRSIVALHNVFDSWLKIGLVIIFILLFGKSSLSVMIGYTISTLVITCSQIYFLNRVPGFKSEVHSKTPNANDWVKKVWIFAWPFSVWGIFTWAQQSSDRWALEMYGSAHEVGLFSVLFQLGYSPIIMLSTLLITFLSPILYEKSGDTSNSENNNKVHGFSWKIVKICVLMTLIFFMVAFFLKNIIFSMFVSEEFRQVSYLYPWMILAGGLFTAGQILALKLMTEMKTKKILPVKIVTALVGVLLNLFGAKFMGLNGIVCSLVIFSLFYMIWMGFLSKSN